LEPRPGRPNGNTARPHNSTPPRSFPQERINFLELSAVVCGVAYMTPAERIEKAFDDAHVVIADYLQPGPRNAEETLNQLIRVIDDRELYDAIVEILRAEGRQISLAPA
jgi:hypothetical protein